MFLHQGSHIEIGLVAASTMVGGRGAATRFRRSMGGIVIAETCVGGALPKGRTGRGTRCRSRGRTFRHTLLRSVCGMTGERT